MAWPTDSLGKKLSEVDTVMFRVKEYSQRRKADMSSGPVASGVIIDLRTQMIQAKQQLEILQSVVGLQEYARGEKGSDMLDIAKEFAATKAAINSVISGIESSFPVDDNGYLLATRFTSSGIQDRKFSSEATAQLRGLLDTLIATVE
jgi:hypothetical protein